MNIHTECLLCSESRPEPLPAFDRAALVKCRNCQLVFSEKIPSHEELQAHYAGYPRAAEISPLTLERYRELLQKMEPYRKTGRLIDVGCGDGWFLAEAIAAGWEVWGTEFTEEAVEICRSKGVNMHIGPLQSKNYEAGFFDVITSFEVMEHINNQCEEVANFHQILRPGGLVYLTTPNFNSVSRYLLGQNWSVIEYPEHLTYFTPKTISKLFGNQGFKVKKVLTSGIGIGRIISFLRGKKAGGVANENIAPTFRQTDEVLRQKTEKNFIFALAKLIINAFLDFTGSGDTLKAFFVKK